MRTDLIKKLTCLGLALTGGQVLLAQTTTGALAGRITDPEGKPVKGALVRANSDSLIMPRETRTDGKGEWRLGLLPPGDYKIRVSQDGFYARTMDLYVGVGKTESLKIFLKKVEISGATVEVIDSSQLLVAKTEVKTSTNFSGDQLIALPDVKNFTDFMKYSTGFDESSKALRGAGLNTGVRYTVDGIESRDDLNYRNSTTPVSMVSPIYDSIQDIQVVQSTVNARNGRTLGSHFIMVTKRGGNEFAGSMRAYWSRDNWGSDDSALSSIGSSTAGGLNSVKWNWTFSGPLVKDRVSFFLSGILSPAVAGMDQGSVSWDNSRTDVRNLAPIKTGRPMDPLATGAVGTDVVLFNGPGNGYSPNVPTVSTPFGSQTKNRQIDGRVTASLSADHSLDLKYSVKDTRKTNSLNYSGYSMLAEDRRLVGNFLQTSTSWSVGYTGVLTSKLLLEANLSQAQYETGGDSNSINGAQVPVLSNLEVYDPVAVQNGYRYLMGGTPRDGLSSQSVVSGMSGSILMASPNSPKKETHSQRTFEVNVKTFVDLLGQHEVDAGFELYKMVFNPGTQIGAQNRLVYAGGWYKKDADYVFPTVVWEGAGKNGQRFGALGPAPVLMEAWADSMDQVSKSRAAWFNDQWVINDHWNVNLGLRWNTYQMNNGDGRQINKSVALEPRILVRWDPKGNGQHLFTLSFTRNAQGFSNVLAANLAVNPMNVYTLRGWKGINGQPALSSLGTGTDGNQYGVRFVSYADLTNPNNFFDSPYSYTVRGAQTRINGMRAPYADQVELSYARNLSDATSLRLSLVDKRFKQESLTWTDYTWDNLVLATDPSGRTDPANPKSQKPRWLQVTNYGSTRRARVFRDIELSLDHKLTSRLNWNLAWSYLYEYTPDEQGRLNYASVKNNPNLNPIPAELFLGDGVTQRSHRVTSIMNYIQPLGAGNITYTVVAIYTPVAPSSLKGTYTMNGIDASTLLDPNDPVHNPNGYPVQAAAGYSTLPVYYARPGDWKSDRDKYTFNFSISWTVPISSVYKKLMFIGTASVSDVAHHVTPGPGYGADTPVTGGTGSYSPNGRVLGSFSNGSVSPVRWGSMPASVSYRGTTSSTRPVSNVSAGFRF